MIEHTPSSYCKNGHSLPIPQDLLYGGLPNSATNNCLHSNEKLPSSNILGYVCSIRHRNTSPRGEHTLCTPRKFQPLLGSTPCGSNSDFAGKKSSSSITLLCSNSSNEIFEHHERDGRVMPGTYERKKEHDQGKLTNEERSIGAGRSSPNEQALPADCLKHLTKFPATDPMLCSH